MAILVRRPISFLNPYPLFEFHKTLFRYLLLPDLIVTMPETELTLDTHSSPTFILIKHISIVRTSIQRRVPRFQLVLDHGRGIKQTFKTGKRKVHPIELQCNA